MKPLPRLTLLLPIVACVATAAAQEQGRPAPDQVFDRLDADGDGFVIPEEMPEFLRPNFGRIDTDGDGRVSRAENTAALNRMRQNRPEPAAADDAGVELLDYAGEGNPRQVVALVLPEGHDPQTDEPLPVVVFVHGGAWLGGDYRQGMPFARPLTGSGDYAFASVGYRLTGEATWPAQIHDVKAAIRQIRGVADQYGLDPNRIAAIGPSAGGHLVAMLGTTGDDETLEGDLGEFDDLSSAVACVVDEFGPADLLTMGTSPSDMDHNGPNSPESRLVGGPVQEVADVSRSASPTEHVDAADPPFLIIHGTEDPLVPYTQSVLLNDKLRAAGVETSLLTVEGGGHGGFRNREINDTIKRFLDKHLLGRDATFEDRTIPNEG